MVRRAYSQSQRTRRGRECPAGARAKIASIRIAVDVRGSRTPSDRAGRDEVAWAKLPGSFAATMAREEWRDGRDSSWSRWWAGAAGCRGAEWYAGGRPLQRRGGPRLKPSRGRLGADKPKPGCTWRWWLRGRVGGRGGSFPFLR